MYSLVSIRNVQVLSRSLASSVAKSGRFENNQVLVTSSRYFSESSDIVNEVKRVMAKPEDAQGNPVALDFSKGSKTKGYSKPYSNNFDNIFGKKKEVLNNPNSQDFVHHETMRP